MQSRVENRNNNRDTNCYEKFAIAGSYAFVIIFFPIAIFFCLIVVPEYQRAVILRLGRLRKGLPRGPGVCFVLPCIDEVIRVDLRTASFDVPAQEILTKDSVTIRVDAIVYFRIDEPNKAVLKVGDAKKATQYLAQTTLRTVAGTKTLIELLSSREQLSIEILQVLDEATDAWGVKVERVEMKDIQLPISMQRALAQEAEAIREARAKIVSAEGEMEASIALKKASDIMRESPMTLQEIIMPKQLQRAMAAEQEAMREAKAKVAAADGELQSSAVLKEASETMAQNPISLQLRYLQTLSSVSADKNHTVVVPFPLDILRKFFGSSNDDESGNSNSKPKTSEIKPKTPEDKPKTLENKPKTNDFSINTNLDSAESAESEIF